MMNNYNVIDYYKEWEVDQIKADLDTKRLPFVAAFENISGDFNKATGMRNANAFMAKEVWIIGDKKWDRRGAVGTHNYMHLKHSPSLEEIWVNDENIRSMRWVAIDNIPGAIPITDYKWQENTFMIFGEERRGISNSAISLADDIVYIPQLGSVRSLNVGTACGIAMYDYASKIGMI
jgi:tRNA G18 (ribose-2'-O)-methylase SpoU